jgi:hypothetical protein
VFLFSPLSKIHKCNRVPPAYIEQREMPVAPATGTESDNPSGAARRRGRVTSNRTQKTNPIQTRLPTQFDTLEGET